jgi:AcrR family transcriptional regulator
MAVASPRRSRLAQDRSRRTRDALVEAAFALWAERGFEAGIETTTVEEIARAAGVTKGTFYFHFAQKVDVLLEIEVATDEAMAAEVVRALGAGDAVDEAVHRAFVVMAQRTEAVPRAAIARVLREYHRSPTLAREQSSFRTLLPSVFADARARGELPSDVNPNRLANLVGAIAVSSSEAWVEGRAERLGPELRYGLSVLFAGIRAEHRGTSASDALIEQSRGVAS